jgi:hypothetical protein
MTTRSQHGIVKPVDRLKLHASHSGVAPVPVTYRSALADPHWRQAMQDEYDALISNSTWTLVPKPTGANNVMGKWIFKHKFHSDGSLARYKARWVVRGYSQRPSIDFESEKIMYCNIGKLCAATSKIIYCNISNSSTATSQKSTMKHENGNV